MTKVIDASAVVAALIDAGPEGSWADAQIGQGVLAAPSLMTYEAANILRRSAISGSIPGEVASLAYADLLDLPVRLFPFEPLAERIWELRGTATVYDSSYVALAELLDAPLVTLDRRLTRAAGARCRFELPGAP